MKENLESNLLKVQIKRQRTAEARPCAKIGPAFIWWTGSFQLPAQNSMRFASRIFFCNCLILPVDKQKAWIDGMLQPCSNDSAVIASKPMSLNSVIWTSDPNGFGSQKSSSRRTGCVCPRPHQPKRKFHGKNLFIARWLAPAALLLLNLQTSTILAQGMAFKWGAS